MGSQNHMGEREETTEIIQVFVWFILVAFVHMMGGMHLLIYYKCFGFRLVNEMLISSRYEVEIPYGSNCNIVNLLKSVTYQWKS